MSCKKSLLGQFMTTNSDYILQGFELPKDIKTVIEPFAGNGDLVNFIMKKNKKIKVECYDIEPKNDKTILRDTILNPPKYKDNYVITNPPYLARNKCTNKEPFDKYKVNDLYKCFIKELTKEDNICSGGIVIIPLNFWCSIRKMDIELRKNFLEIYKIVRVNVFEDQVFDDTGYSVCSFQFEKRKEIDDEHDIPFFNFPKIFSINIKLNEGNSYTIGGELYNLPKNKKYKITRLLGGETPNTNILVKCLDDKGKKNIGLTFVDDKDIFYDDTPNHSARTFATLVINPELNIKQQNKLVEDFNNFLSEKREKYNSLFMSNYREAGRKRISFDLVYDIVNYLLRSE